MLKKLTARRNCIGMETNEIIEAVLEDRGIEDIVSFLNPTEDDLVPFEKMKNIDKAANIILDTIDKNGRFLMHFDVDNDGTCAGSLMTRYLRHYTDNVDTYINNKKEHGVKSLDIDMFYQYDTVIIVDSINDVEVYRDIANTGVQIVICDHHICPPGVADKNVPWCLVSSANEYPNPALSGAGVVMRLCQYLDYLTLNDYANEYWDLAASGIIGDLSDVSMNSPENRYICYMGFNNPRNMAIQLINGGFPFDSTAVSFGISPLINACNRVNDNQTAVDLFLSDNKEEAKELIKRLKADKEQQNIVVEELMPDLLRQAKTQMNQQCMFFVIPNDLDVSVSGLLGNRLLSQFMRPLVVVQDCIITDDETGKAIKHEMSGSARAVGIRSFKKYVDDLNVPWCWAAGHENACGFGCDIDHFEEFKVAIEGALKDVVFECDVEADIELEPSQLDFNLVRQINALDRISGQNWKPIKVLVRTNDYSVETFSNKKHLKVVDNDSQVILVKWNTDIWKTMQNDCRFLCVGSLSAPTYGRKHYIQVTIDEFVQNKTDE